MLTGKSMRQPAILHHLQNGCAAVPRGPDPATPRVIASSRFAMLNQLT